jgi:hydrogenase maturation factor HypE
MARIEGREPGEELEIPPLVVSFPKAIYVMQPNNGAEDIVERLVTVSINTLEEDKVEGSDTKIVVEREDEVLQQLTVHILEEVPTKTFERKLAKGEKFQNWVTQEAPVVFKM